jgi:uncharacterized membrane protein
MKRKNFIKYVALTVAYLATSGVIKGAHLSSVNRSVEISAEELQCSGIYKKAIS